MCAPKHTQDTENRADHSVILQNIVDISASQTFHVQGQNVLLVIIILLMVSVILFRIFVKCKNDRKLRRQRRMLDLQKSIMSLNATATN